MELTLDCTFVRVYLGGQGLPVSNVSWHKN